MARATGGLTVLNMAYESTYGTSPTSGFFTLPFADVSLGTEQPLLESDLLGSGRDPVAPQRDAITTNGDVTIPIGLDDIGYWLKLLLGGPTTTGTTPKTHTFVSGATSLPSASIEIGNPEVPAFDMHAGCMANTLDINMQRGGLLTAKVGLIAQGNALATSTLAGTPAAVAVTRFGHFNGAVKRDGVSLANITAASLSYSNGLEPVETIRADGKIDGIDLTQASLKGKITSRFADTTLLTQATSGSACSLEFSWVIDANKKLVITAHSVFLPVPKRQISGKGGISVDFDWMAAKAASPARMMTAVLTNSVTSY